jgi:hypothetical protein
MSYAHDSGTAGGTPVDVTVPAGTWVYSWGAVAASSGTAIIAPDGVTAQPTIPVGPAGIGFTWPDPPASRPPRLGPGAKLTFTDCAYLVVYA